MIRTLGNGLHVCDKNENLFEIVIELGDVRVYGCQNCNMMIGLLKVKAKNARFGFCDNSCL